MPQELHFGKEGRDKLLVGVRNIAKAVKLSLGAKGRNALIGNLQGVTSALTKDGHTIAQKIVFPNQLENMGALLVKEAAKKTVDAAGDGTTTATILAEYIICEGSKAIDEGANPLDVKRGIDKATAEVVAFIKKVAKQVNSDSALIKQVATVSANNDSELGDLIAQGMKKVGNDGAISVEYSHSYETTIEPIDGVQIDEGFISPHFINVEERGKCILENPLILFFDRGITSAQAIFPIIQIASKKGQPLLIITSDLSDEALGTIILNKNRGAFHGAAIRTPAVGVRRKNLMDDITTICGGNFITEDMGIKLEKVNEFQLGTAERVEIDKKKTIIIKGKGNKSDLEGRIKDLKTLIEETTDPDEKAFLKSRLAKLSNGVAVLKIGGITITEIKEKSDRIDDALWATRSAVEEGVIPGGGSTFMHAVHHLNSFTIIEKDEKIGFDIVKKAIQQPFYQILSNAAVKEPEKWAEGTKAGIFGMGYNVKTERVEDLMQAGIIDPAKVARVALENAASIGGEFIKTECVVSDVI